MCGCLMSFGSPRSTRAPAKIPPGCRPNLIFTSRGGFPASVSYRSHTLVNAREVVEKPTTPREGTRPTTFPYKSIDDVPPRADPPLEEGPLPSAGEFFNSFSRLDETKPGNRILQAFERE